jgi:ABC-type sugar transport system ATPase subunit
LSTNAGGEALRVEHVAKSFGAVTALVDVSLRLERGEVLGLIGDNGAGKSTLIKILTGYIKPDKGQIFVGGEPVTLRSVDQARSLGIDTVYQDLALVPTLSVAHNMFLNREVTRGIGPFRWLDNREMRRRARSYIEAIGIRTLRSVSSEVAMLSGGQRQAIAIARSVHTGAKILLLDEPLAAMGAMEGEMILDLIRDLKAEGHSMIVVAHNYVHVLEICDRVNLLQHGRITLDRLSSETSAEELTELVAREYRRLRDTTSSAGSVAGEENGPETPHAAEERPGL